MPKTTKLNTNSYKIKQQNILEVLRDIGTGTAKGLTEVIKPEEFFTQILKPETLQKKYSGDIAPGEKLMMNEIFSGNEKSNQKLRNQLYYERSLHNEERLLSEKRINDLRLKLHALIQEVANLANSTQNLAQEAKTAALQAPVEAGIYHITFFEKLLTFLISFRKKIDNATVWLSATNKRAEKKNYWTMYKQKKGSFLLAPDHYLQRSAG